jgi:RNA polymerase sigma-70 factor (ECF subfamily)
MTDPSDDFDAILGRAREGEPAALDDLLARSLPALRAFVRLRTGEAVRAKESCSDLVQSVCVEALRELPACRAGDESQFRGWLCTVALHKILDKRKFWEAARRDAGREAQPGAASSDGDLLAAYATFCTPSQDLAAQEEVARIERAFDALPEDYREVIALSRLAGLSHRDIAERLGSSEAAVRQLLHRARARLARLLGASAP